MLLPLSASASADQVAAGGDASCAVVAAGGVNCWGVPPGYENLPESLKRLIADDVPTPLYNIDDVATDVSLAGDHGCAVVAGAALCWGSNDHGQLGDGTTDDSDLPVSVVGFSSGVTDIAAADGATCAIKAGAVHCWGNRYTGVFGANYIGNELTPFAISGVSAGATAISIGSEMACAAVTGQAICWGYGRAPIGREGDYFEILPPGVSAGLSTGVQSVSIGGDHVCAIVSGGVRCWGDNSQGQFGNGAISQYQTDDAVQVTGLTSGVTALTVGSRISCAVVSGAAKCWGENARGIFGDGTVAQNSNQPSTPVGVTGLDSGVDAVAAAGSNHVCARQAGAIKCWGAGNLGALGNAPPIRSTTPLAVSGGTNFTHLAVGERKACAVEAEATKCWGDEQASYWIDSIHPKPLDAPFNSGVTALSVGYYGYCGITAGSVRCGEGDSSGLPGLESGATAVASHDMHACGSTATVVRCWGDDYGISAPPVTINGVGSSITALAAGFRFDCAITGGGARCWGEDYHDQLGVPTAPDNTRTPVTPTGLSSGVTSIAAGSDFACAVVSGAAECWGDGYSGQLGTGSLANAKSPTQVVGLTSGVLSISASSHHACALTTGGAIYCWGENDAGQLGSGDLEESSVPVPVQGASSGATEVSAGNQSTCARIGGVAKCWGSNKFGLLGIGTAYRKLTPVATAAAASAKPFVAILSPVQDSLHAAHSVSFDVYSDTAETVYCKIDGRPYVLCTETITDLEDGDHSVRAKATDGGGHSDSDVVYFSVDTTPPVLALTDLSDDLAAVSYQWRQLSYSSTEQLESATCVVDGGEPRNCHNAQVFVRFEQGLHTVSVTGVDFAGNVGTTTKTFRIGPLPVVTPPTTWPPSIATNKNVGISVRYAFTGSYAKGNRKLIVRTRLVIRDPLVPGRCAGSMRIAAPKLGVAEKSFPLVPDAGLAQCAASRTFKLKRALKGKRVKVTFAFDGNAHYLPVSGSDSKKL